VGGDLVQGGIIGDVRLVTSRQFQSLRKPADMNPGSPPWRIDTALSGGGYFVDMVSHTLDFLDFLLGPIEAVRAFADNHAGAYRAEDVVTATYRFASGAYGTGAFCYAADRDEEWNEIVGSRGRIIFSTTRDIPIRVIKGDAMEELPVKDPPHVHQPLIQTIVDELNGSGKCPSTGVTGARTTAVIDDILREFRARPTEASQA
jgi:predicted dehydrogenase